jgi:leucyl-tRNA synthetase
MTHYSYHEIEKKWQARWAERGDYRTDARSDKPKMFLLVEFPYPSGAGLHVGHPRSYVAMDVIARKRRMEGFEVLYPIGFDAFGLPAENYAIKTGVHPRITTEENIANFRRQLKMLGLSFDWEREIDTTDPNYYKWTQWMFLRLFKAGMAYKAGMPINWCPSCNCALANEEVVNGACERCGTQVVRKQKEQWMLRITKYADRLISDLDTVNYIPPVIEQQRNWIGRSDGAEARFALAGTDETLTVFTTRPDTMFGAPYMVVAPEHPLIERHADRITNLDAVRAYQDAASRKSDLERAELATDKTGVPLQGLSAINPATGKEIPIWISDYVLMSYGTGAIMAVPAHDDRDWDFARAFNLPIIEVVSGGDVTNAPYTDCDSGVMVNSGFLDGLAVPEAIKRMTAWLEEQGLGHYKVNYRLRDWVFSRQRYWGEPIPLVNCETCGWVPIPESELPLLLPEVSDFKPSADGISPLANAHDWVNTTCPCCGGAAKRETDTMPQWAGSCWYFIRYIDPHNETAFADPELLKRWMPVDWYNGGMEHTTLHLLYSRFWYKFLFDEGLVPTPEPYQRRTSHGMILGGDREKMSKSRGNVVNPDEVVAAYGTDTFRVYEMFLGEFDKTAVWSDQGVIGVHRFLKKAWALMEKLEPGLEPSDDQRRLMARTMRDVDERTERMKYNTAVSALMEYVNAMTGLDKIPAAMLETFAVLLFPFGPHVAEELWERLGHAEPLVSVSWPKADPALLAEDLVTLAVQVNGKVRDTIQVAADLDQDAIVALALERPGVASRVTREALKKVVYVKGRIVNLIGGQ